MDLALVPPGMAIDMRPGTVVGAYRVLERLGVGGMGEVWVAEHALLGRKAAIKFLQPEYSAREDVVARFFNEARAATAIADPGIVQIFDYGHHTDGSAYIVMELLHGEPLDARLRRGSMSVAETLRIIRQVASSLGEAHARGIVHRDLKPDNIFLVRDPEVAGGERAKILDFGIAKISNGTGQRTQTEAIMGTPKYMSPEQCRGAGHVDRRADIYSLGCVMFTMLAGRTPFDGEGAGELIVQHMTVAAPRLVGVPHAVEELVARCLAKDPGQRFESGTHLASVISALLGQDLGPASSFVGRSSQLAAAAPTTLSGSAAYIASPPPRRGRGLAIGVTACVAIGAAVIVLVRPGEQARSIDALEHVQAPPEDVLELVRPDAAVQPLEPDRREEAIAAIHSTASSFVVWAKTHPGAACPTAADVGARLDPWGTPLVVTCADQPDDQIIGIVSAGADRIAGTADDISSWTLDVTAIRGGRWKPKRKPIATVRRPAAGSGSATTTTTVPPPPAGSGSAQGSATPLDTDQHGIPIRR